MSQLFFLTIACIFGFVAAGTINGPCCYKKTVGNVSYTNVEQTDTSKFDCLSNCVYEQDGVPGSRFCFAHGELPVVCNGIRDDVFCRDGILWKEDKDLLDELKNHEHYPDFPDSLVRKHFMCCNGDPCLGSNCSSICGPSGKQLDCVLDVGHPELEDKNYCEDVGRTYEGRPYDAVMSSTLRSYMDDFLTQSQCNNHKSKKACPKNTEDTNCACCKWPTYVNDLYCSDGCLCKGVCEWVTNHGYTDSTCCSYCKTACPGAGSNAVTPSSILQNNSGLSLSDSPNSYSPNSYSRTNYYDVTPLCKRFINPNNAVCPESISMCVEAVPTYFDNVCPDLTPISASAITSDNASTVDLARSFPSVIFLSICFNVIFIKFL